jgi:hypothetical protein
MKIFVDKLPKLCAECVFYRRKGCADYVCGLSGRQLQGGFFPTPKDNKWICGLKEVKSGQII